MTVDAEISATRLSESTPQRHCKPPTPAGGDVACLRFAPAGSARGVEQLLCLTTVDCAAETGPSVNQSESAASHSCAPRESTESKATRKARGRGAGPSAARHCHWLLRADFRRPTCPPSNPSETTTTKISQSSSVACTRAQRHALRNNLALKPHGDLIDRLNPLNLVATRTTDR